MDDIEYQLSAQELLRMRSAEAKLAHKAKQMRCVGQDVTTGERLLQDDNRAIYLSRKNVAVVKGAVVVREQTLNCVRLQVPALLQIVISGLYGAPPLPILAEFDEGVFRPINVDALRL